MGEYSYRIEKALQNGLRPASELQESEGYLEALTGLRPSKYGLIEETQISKPAGFAALTPNLSAIVNGYDSYGILYNFNDPWYSFSLYKINADFSLTLEFTNGDNIYMFSDWTSAPSWFAADAVEYELNYVNRGGTALIGGTDWWIANVSRLIDSPPNSWMGDTDSATGAVAGAFCMLGDRLVMSNFAGILFNQTFWDDRWDLLNKYCADTTIMGPKGSIGRSHIIVGTPFTGAQENPFLLELGLISFGTASTSDPITLAAEDAIRKRQFALLKLPWRGTVIKLKELANRVIVYGSDGIGYLAQDSTGAFHLERLLNIGIARMGCVGGDRYTHYFVTKDDQVWKINNEYIPLKLDFDLDDYGLDGGPQRIIMDPRTGDVSFGSTSYIFGLSGDAGYTPLQRNLAIIEDSELSYGLPQNTVTDPTFSLTQHLTKLGRQGIKRINSIGLSFRNLDDLQVSVLYRYKESEAYVESPALTPNDEGVVWPVISGTDLKVKVTGTYVWDSEPTLDYIDVRWEPMDSRVVRGLTSGRYEDVTD